MFYKFRYLPDHEITISVNTIKRSQLNCVQLSCKLRIENRNFWVRSVVVQVKYVINEDFVGWHSSKIIVCAQLCIASFCGVICVHGPDLALVVLQVVLLRKPTAIADNLSCILISKTARTLAYTLNSRQIYANVRFNLNNNWTVFRHMLFSFTTSSRILFIILLRD
jgi:hypothetical protein